VNLKLKKNYVACGRYLWLMGRIVGEWERFVVNGKPLGLMILDLRFGIKT
jgi:hypothetical protein